MEEEKSAVKKLKDFAEQTGREIDSSEKQYEQDTLRRYFYRNHAVITSKIDNSVKLVCFADNRAFGDSGFYCGLFFPITAPLESKIKLRKKNLLDKLNPGLKQNDYKNVFRGFDKEVIFDENDFAFLVKLFDNKQIQNLAIDALKLDERLRVGVNEIEISIVPELKDKSHFGIYLTEVWLEDTDVIEKLFGIAESLRKHINN